MRLFVLILALLAYHLSFSQAINVTNAGGGFNQTTTWSSGARPSSSNTGTWNNGGGSIGTISLNGTSATGSPCTNGTTTAHNATGYNCGEIGSLSGNKNGGTINISYARIKILGNFGLNNGVVINISNGGILEITGNITVNNGLDVNFGANCGNCKLLVNNFTAGENAAITVSGGGEFEISGNFTAGNGVNMDIDADSEVSVGGDFNIGGGTVTVAGCTSGCSTDGQLTIGGNVNVPAGTIDGDGTVIVTSDPDYVCDDPNLNCVDGQGDPLPVVLGSFTVSQINNEVLLKWQTLSEINFNYFQIEKLSGSDFQVIEMINSTGNEQGDTYSFTDRNPETGLNIYRLQSIDFDGFTEKFPAQSVIFEPRNLNLQFYPNPAQTGHIFSDISSDFFLEIYEINGKLIKQEQIRQNNIDIVNCLPAGIYILKYDINGLRKSQRMIIR